MEEWEDKIVEWGVARDTGGEFISVVVDCREIIRIAGEGKEAFGALEGMLQEGLQRKLIGKVMAKIERSLGRVRAVLSIMQTLVEELKLVKNSSSIASMETNETLYKMFAKELWRKKQVFSQITSYNQSAEDLEDQYKQWLKDDHIDSDLMRDLIAQATNSQLVLST
eukprot:TRINITY_DN18529_c0_g1_i1.p1 TRINITY_DN18529_c0_g1~~TRINITY_DN18529_c0_g1_i1.p1  ORF type:complete len:167 (-),score=30.22 TRINITY_DN18529_c0_g1_i1:9-509(-)